MRMKVLGGSEGVLTHIPEAEEVARGDNPTLELSLTSKAGIANVLNAIMFNGGRSTVEPRGCFIRIACKAGARLPGSYGDVRDEAAHNGLID
jgi:hypothetical protein